MSDQKSFQNRKLSSASLCEDGTVSASLNRNLRRLPLEVEFQVILHLLHLQRQPCLQHSYSTCYDPWSCKAYHCGSIHLPPRYLLSVCKAWRFEAIRCFFKHNTVVFNTDTLMLSKSLSKDPHATQLLDFVDQQESEHGGTELERKRFSYPAPEHVETYRHSIRELILAYTPHSDGGLFPGNSTWDWKFKIDWTSLPDLEILYLDFKGLGLLNTTDWGNGWDLALFPSVISCAERMKCLSLKKLVLMNVDYGYGERGILGAAEKEEFKTLWRGALASDGDLDIKVDDSRIWGI